MTEFRKTSSFQDLLDWSPRGKYVEVGFRPSGRLHVGNLLTIGYAAAIADQMSKTLRITCCDTDWSAHLHEQHQPSNNRTMKLFFMRSCPCGEHGNVAEHRMDELSPFIDVLRERLGIEPELRYLSDLHGDEEYTSSLRKVLRNMEEFDSFYGGGFRRRYISPVTVVCSNCGYSHSKGASYSPGTDEMVAPCRNLECSQGFASEPLTGEIGVYYLVDPVRDASEDTAIHVFGGDYGVAQKGQKTSKIEKVMKTTGMVGETPAYFIAPTVADEDGKPLSKSKGGGKTPEGEELREAGLRMVADLSDWLLDDRTHVAQDEI